jgi:hypothetical protein
VLTLDPSYFFLECLEIVELEMERQWERVRGKTGGAERRCGSRYGSGIFGLWAGGGCVIGGI